MKKSVVDSAWDAIRKSRGLSRATTQEELFKGGWIPLPEYAKILQRSESSARRIVAEDPNLDSDVFWVRYPSGSVTRARYVRPKSLSKTLEKRDTVRNNHTNTCEL